ncbi:MAG: alkaline phosphatase [Pirellulaceae bacterium]
MAVENGGRYVVAQRTSGIGGRDALMEAANSAAENGNRLFGFFGTSSGHLPFQTANGDFVPTRGASDAERYEAADIVENPTLADMTEAALIALTPSQKEKGFWLMVEAGDVDWANHNNNLDDSIGAVFSGEAAFQKIVEWVEENSNWNETLLIVTADHGHYLNLVDPEAVATAAIENAELERASVETNLKGDKTQIK